MTFARSLRTVSEIGGGFGPHTSRQDKIHFGSQTANWVIDKHHMTCYPGDEHVTLNTGVKKPTLIGHDWIKGREKGAIVVTTKEDII
jgi:hypothetical protein